MDINELRVEIDKVDKGLLELFTKRMEISADIAEYKSKNGMPIYDPARERQKLYDIAEKSSEDMRIYTSALYSLLFDLSRSYQGKIIEPEAEITAKLVSAIESSAKMMPQQAVIACQGVEGAYSQQACEKLFTTPSIMYCSTFDAVFAAIDSGLCQYGILPLENSTAGSINRVYDLMMDYNFSIVRSTRLKIDHNLLAKKGTAMADIKEIYSHEQAISQCAEYLKTLNVKVTPCENTAVAAKLVAESDRNDVAALSSAACAELYGLARLSQSVQDKGNNYTRFICISKKLEIYPGADKTSIMLSVPHRPGSLYKILSHFYTLGINLIKLESRPIPDRDFEFMFYFDIETSVYSPALVQIISELSRTCDEFRYLGSYAEIV